MEKILKEMYNISPYSEYDNKTYFDKIIGSPTYGEITQKGTNDLVEFFHEYFNKDCVFYDLGSGLSKMVIHIGLQYGIKKSTGIEYSKERHKGALFLKEKYAKNNDNIEVINKDMLKCDISDATVIYVDNTVFTDEIMEKLYKIIPSGCLMLYKKRIKLTSKDIVHLEPELIERTYKQSKLRWHIQP
tara:strand:- start:1121 stop:1681 length:561 start_codon:yes stop_codon:yes gene_type:complete